MRFIGIDIASEVHTLAIVDESGQVLLKPTTFAEAHEGYEKLLERIGSAEDALVAMEATGHYWQNVFAKLATAGFRIALINPLQTRRFAEADLERTKTDAIDAIGIARFAASKRPAVTLLTDEATAELRELVRFRDRSVQELGDKVRQLHRLVDLGFPEFTNHVRTLDSELATAILREYPTAKAFEGAKTRKRLAKLVYDGRRAVGDELARTIWEAAERSVGAHHGQAYKLQVCCLCDDIAVLRERIRSLDRDIRSMLDKHEVGTLLTTIGGIGPTTAARLVAELGDIASFGSVEALAAYVGVVPGIKHSGKKKPLRAGLSAFGNARLRAKLWMPTMRAVRCNPWLRAFYERLIARGKLKKVAITAAMRKLLAAVLSVAKNRRPFVPVLTSPEGAPP